jgi:hypothetical protein
MGNDSYALTNMNLLDIPLEVASQRGSSDWFVYYNRARGQWRRAVLTTSSSTELNYLDIATLGTGAASKAIVLDANGDYTFPSTATIVMPSSGTMSFSAGSSLTLSGTLVRTPASLTATASLTAALHANRTSIITGTAAAAYTLPAATGSGDCYRIIMGQVNTNGTTIVTNAPASVSMYGSINILDVDAATQAAFFTVTAGGTDTITLNGTTTGGQIGDIVELIDIATDKWAVWGQFRCPAGSNVATMFSSAA